MTKNKWKTETWRYTGRILDGKTLFYSYEDGDGELRVFKKLPATSPGAFYVLDVERKKDGGITVHGSSVYVIGQEIDDEDPVRIRAQADDRAVSIELETRRAEKAGAYQEIEANLDALRSLYLRQTGGRRAAFLAHVIQRVTKR